MGQNANLDATWQEKIILVPLLDELPVDSALRCDTEAADPDRWHSNPSKFIGYRVQQRPVIVCPILINP
jgi:hypothetical protein